MDDPFRSPPGRPPDPRLTEPGAGRSRRAGTDRKDRTGKPVKPVKTAGEAKSMGALIWWGLISLVILVLERETFFS